MADDHDDERYRPSLRESLENWRHYQGSFGKKLRLTLKNELKKARTLSNCCGNIDEPGC